MNITLSTADLFRQLLERRAGGIGTLLEELGRRPDLPTLALDVLKTGDAQARVMALVALRGLSGPAIWDAALNALQDSSPNVRQLAVQRLATAPATTVWPALVAALNDPDLQVKKQAMVALATIDPEATADLLRTRLAAPDLVDRLAAWSAMQVCKIPGFVPEALQALHDENDEVRRHALLQLSQQASHVPMATLLQLLDDPVTAVRSLALTTLRRKGDASACSAILRLLYDSVPLLRRMALITLGDLGCSEAVDWLVERADQFATETDKALFIATLGKLGDRGLRRLIRPALQDASPVVRRAALTAYVPWLSANSARKLLRQTILQDASPLVRSTAIATLGTVGGRGAQKTLTEVLLEEQDASLRRVAANALALTATSSSIAALRASLKDENAEVRATVTKSLGQLRATQAIADLQAMQGRETNLDVLAEIQAALARIDAATFASPGEDSVASALFDPGRQGLAFTVWLHDPTWYPVSERLIFYNTGDMEAIDLEEQTQRYRYTAKPEQLHLYRVDDQKEFICPFTIKLTVWENPTFGPQHCYRLQLDDFLLITNTESERVVFYANGTNNLLA